MTEKVSVRLAAGTEVIVITGLSGSGKTSQGRDLAGFLDAAYIDQDKSFIHPRDMGTVDYKGHPVPLYDQESSIDFLFLRETVAAKSFSKRKVILVGFYLPPKVLENFNVTKYIILNIDQETSMERRKRSKSRSGRWNAVKDEWMVKNYVVPFYQKGIRKMKETDGEYDIVEIDATRSREEVWNDVKALFV
jgi:thymidylate kinase